MKILYMVVVSVVVGFLFISCAGRHRQDSLETSLPSEAPIIKSVIPTNAPSCENLFTAAETGTNSYCLKVSPEQPLVHPALGKPIVLAPGAWYEFSYSYRMQPPVRFEFYIIEKITNDFQFCRNRAAFNHSRFKTDEFVRDSFRFMSRPGASNLQRHNMRFPVAG